METSLAESQTDSYFPTKWPNGYPKQKDVSDTVYSYGIRLYFWTALGISILVILR